MKIVGIDFSIRYPSVCICDNFEEFQFASVVNTKVSNKRIREVQQSLDEPLEEYDDIFIQFPDYETSSSDSDFHKEQRNKLLNHVRLSQSLVNTINQHVLPKEDVIVAIEGIAYGAKGSSLIDIAMATGIVRADLLLNVLHGQASNFFVFTPSELKNAIGYKGNATKDVIFEQFLSDPGIPAVKDSGLYKYLIKNQNEHYVRKGNNIESPWNDMIDGYLAVKRIYNILNNN